MRDKSYIKNKTEGNIIQAEIVFGQLGSDCRGHGICQIIERGSSIKNCNQMSVDIEGLSVRQIAFHFSTSKIDLKVFQKYVIGMEFILNQYFWLPDFVYYQLGLEKRVIASGKYYVHSTKEELAIKFPLV